MLGTVLVASTLAAPAAEEAEPVPLFAEWTAPAECPDREGLWAQIEAVVGREVRFEDDAKVRVSGRAIAIADGYQVDLVITVDQDREERVLTAAVCDDVVRATALVVGVALEPFLSSSSSVPAPPPEPIVEGVTPEPTATAAPQPAAARLERTTRRRFRHRAALFVGGGGAFAMTARAAGTLTGGAGWLIDRARIELSAHHRFATPPDPGRSARMSTSGAALRGCWLPRFSSFELGPCGGLEVSALLATGTGDDVVPRTAVVPWISLLAGMDFAWIATPLLALRASATAGFVPSRPQLHLASADRDHTVFVAPPVNARLTLAVEIRLPGRALRPRGMVAE